MSYQFVHTSALHLLDTQASGYGTVARSENLPRAICNKLSALSIYREPSKQAVTVGPQFSYHIIDHAGEAWHVLTCTQQAGADYSGRACHIAHHLILTQKEVSQLLENEFRPTPAGVTLALLKSGFWLNSWKEEPRFITSEPQFNPHNMPDASTQAVWKQITGHKSNARAFFTQPYHRECLITLTAGIPAHLLLCLFHESDWLTPSRGWGSTYTTEADDNDSFSETLRMACVEDSPLVIKSERTGHPVLKITMGMELPIPPANPTSTPENSKSSDISMVRGLSRSLTHYHYTEEPDWILYDVRKPLSRRTLVWGAAAFGIGVAAVVIGGCDTSAPQPDISLPIIKIDNDDQPTAADYSQEELSRLKVLLKAAYDHEATQKLLIELSNRDEKTPEDTLMMESSVLILNAQQGGTNHTAAIKRLCECARLLHISDAELVQLYLREATYNIDKAQWQEQMTAENLASWIELKQSEPQILEILEHPDFQPYTPTTTPTPDATILATAEPSHGEDEEPTSPTPQKTPGRVSLVPRPVVSGNSLPSELESIIPKLPCTVDTGFYIVSAFEEGGALEAPQKLELTPDGFRLYIASSGKPGIFTVKPEHVQGAPSPLPAVSFEVKGGKLRRIHCSGSTAVVSFPVPAKDDFHTNVVLVPTFALPIPSKNDIKLPPAAKAGLDITPDDLEVIPPTSQKASAKLKLKKRKSFPWVLGREQKENIRFSLQLPVLTGHNSIRESSTANTPYEWKGATVTNETEALTTIRCSLERSSTLPERLERVFNSVANETCCGEEALKDETMCLAQLYYIVNGLSSDKLQSGEAKKLHQAYFRLFSNKRFNKVLMRVFEQDTILQLPPDIANLRKFENTYKRSHIKQLLGEHNYRNLIRQRICEVLSRALYAAYTQEQKALEAEARKTPLFVLKDISVGNHVELLWKFRIEYANSKS